MALIDIYKKLYPLDSKVAYYESGYQTKPKLGIVVGYQKGLYGEHHDHQKTYVNVMDAEFPEYILHIDPHAAPFKVYYTKEAEDRDQKNREFF